MYAEDVDEAVQTAADAGVHGLEEPGLRRATGGPPALRRRPRSFAAEDS
jgi:hypothetical protein